MPNAREVWAWGMYDLANQSFTLIVITMYFGLFVKNVVSPDPARGAALWGWMSSASMLVVVLISPFVGALADARGLKKRILIASALVCAALTCGFAGLSPGAVTLTVLLFIPANIAYNLGENLLASFLPEIAPRETMGRVSAIGWTMGYIGALLLLALSVGLILAFGWNTPAQYGPLFVMAGLWFLIATIPAMLFVRERRRHAAQRGVLRLALGRVASTWRGAARFAQLLRFLAVFFLYSTGVQAVIYFAGIITDEGFGFGPIKLTLFILQITVTATLAAIAVGKVQDSLGHRNTISLFLIVWIGGASGLALLLLSATPPEWVFWTLANLIGFGLGGIGTASRAMVGMLTPAAKAAEFFGLWGMAYKLAGVVGIAAFGELWSSAPHWVAMCALAGVFLLGCVLLVFVDERAGIEAARAHEAEGADQPTAADAAARARRQDDHPVA